MVDLFQLLLALIAFAVCVLGFLLAAMLIGLPLRWLLVGEFFPGQAQFLKRLRAAIHSRFGFGRSVTKLARLLRVPASELEMFQPCYYERSIPKRSGGMRRLSVPDDATMAMQRRILRIILARLRSHPAATGFESGLSIADNAKPHVGQCVILKMDVIDFFPSTSAERIQNYFQRIGWNREAAKLLTRLTTHNGGLPQGAPTSPRLSNLVNYGLDASLSKLAWRHKGRYTRYADDITYSFPKDYPGRMRAVLEFAKRKLRGRGYRFNRKKQRILRRHQQQNVTGLVVNECVNIPRRARRQLRAIEHRLNTGGEASMTREQLDGWKAYMAMVERSKMTERSSEQARN